MKEKVANFFKEVKIRFYRPRIFFVVGVFFLVVILLFSGFSVYAYTFKNKVFPNVYLGEIGIGGLTAGDLKGFLQKMDNKLVNEGLHFNYEVNGKKKSFTIYPVITTQGDSVDLVSLDIEKEVPLLLNYKKSNDFFSQTLNLLSLLFNKEQVKLQTVKVDEVRLVEAIKENLISEEIPPQNASLSVQSINPLNYKIVSSSPGVIFDYQNISSQVGNNWSELEAINLEIGRQEKIPDVLENDVLALEKRLPQVFLAGDLHLQYTNPETRREYGWLINLDQIKSWLNVQKTTNNDFVIGLAKDSVVAFLKKITAADIDVSPLDAKFKMDENGKVVEFLGSRPGLTVDVETTYNLINQAVIDRTWHDQGLTKAITIAVVQVEPNIKTGDVNNLGVKEMLGVGYSDYSNSPNNRIKNIKNAINKLNGILIKPGEEFSTLKYTAPFTLEGGYFPELVIKGDEMKAEIGGGLCQIGTTLFRMAMNSGMTITERRNHSLVVSHYNDAFNHNPGTDATVYDPAPDFKFLNDTGNYLLLQTFMNVKKQELEFTLWGTSDGRQGSYTHPVVLKWYSVGDPKDVETDKIAPGKRQCQNAFRGADTSFTYTRILANGQKEDRVFESHYRALPKICLVGVEVLASTSTLETAVDVPATVE